MKNNVMSPQPQFGYFVELQESTLDWRDYLNGDPIHNGDLLEWWSGTGWQLVRYESAGRANAFLVMEDDTTHTRSRNNVVPLAAQELRQRGSMQVVKHTNALDTKEIRMHGPISV